jgi:hypothetical protein
VGGKDIIHHSAKNYYLKELVFLAYCHYFKKTKGGL